MTAPSIQIQRLPATDLELWYSIWGLWGMRIPRLSVCAGHSSPFEALADAYFARSPVAVWWASRGLGGKSRTLAALGSTEAALLGCEVTILGGSAAQSQNVHNATKDNWDWFGAPKDLLLSPNRYETVLKNGGHLRTLTASQTSVRGPHPPRLRIDEVDEVTLPILDAALGQPMEQIGVNGMIIPTNTVLSSTWQYPDRCVVEGTSVLTDRGDVPVQKVRIGDKVMTRHGWRDVEDVVFCGQKEYVEVTFASGKVVRTAPTHKFWTNTGWVEASALTPFAMVGVQAIPVSGSVLPNHLVPALSTQHGAVGQGGVGQSEVVTVLADGLGGLIGQGAGVVDRSGDDFQVAGVHASPVAAQVVQGMPIGDRANSTLPNPSVGVHDALGVTSVGLSAVAILGDVQRPYDALVGVQVEDVILQDDQIVDVRHSPMVLPMWDITVSGTHEYFADGILTHNTMAEVLRRARNEHPDWKVHSWCFREASEPTYGWLTPEAIERSKSTVSRLAWEREFELQEPSFEGRAFNSDAVERAFVEDWGVFIGDSMVYAPPAQNRHYLTSVDWAKQRDQTIITTFDTTEHPWVCVAYKKVNGLPWPQLVHEAVKQYRLYGGNFVHDRTGVGEAANDLLRAEMSSAEFSKTTGVVMTGGRDRDAFYNDYIAAIEHDDIRFPRITYVYEEHKYASVEALFTSKEHAPDSVVAGALAWSTRKRSVIAVGPTGNARSSSPWNTH